MRTRHGGKPGSRSISQERRTGVARRSSAFRILRRTVFFAACVSLALTVGCRTHTEPVTGRSQFILTSPAQERKMGLQAWQTVLKEEQLSSSARYQNAIKRVGNNLKKSVDSEDYKWEFRVFAGKQANAFALPSGKVGVYEGLFNYLDNDAELAAVIGHEIGHAVARHGGERMTQAMVINVGALGLGMTMQDKERAERERWLAAYSGLTTVGYLLPFSRKHEYAADKMGMQYMAEAGYDPQAAIEFWKKFVKQQETPGALEFLSTHPMGEKRLEQLRSYYNQAYLAYQMAPVKHGYGEQYD